MERKIFHVKNCIAEVLNYLLYVMTELVLFSLIGVENPTFLRFAFPVVIPLFYYLVRCLVHRFWFFLLLHLLPFIGIILGYGDSVTQRVIFLLAAILQAIVSLYIRVTLRSDPNRKDYGIHEVPPLLAVGIAAGLIMLNGNGGKESTERLLMQMMIIFFVVYFICLFLDKFLYYTEMSKKTAGNVPIKAILSINFAIVGGFAGICAVMMAALADRNFARFLSELVKRILWEILVLLYYLVRLIKPIMKDNPVKKETWEFAEMGTGNNVLAKIIDFLMTVLGIVLLVAFAAAVVYGVIKLIKWGFAYRNKDTAKEGEGSGGDIVEKLERKKSHYLNRRGGWFKTPDEKIRKIFETALQKRYKQKADPEWERVLCYGTARECLLLFGEEDEEAARVLVNIYEKARYAKDVCTAEDVREAARMAKKL